MTGIIYVAENLSNGKRYVGKTTKSLPRRVAQHVWSAKNGSTGYFHHALNRHGREAFKFYTVCVVSESDLNFYETLFISTLGLTNQNFGYNGTEGGEGGSPSPATVAKRSGENHWTFGKPRSEETKRKISETKKSDPNIGWYWKGRKRTPENIQKFAEAVTRKDLHNAEIASLYLKGSSLNEIARELKASPEIIRLRLLQQGVKMRSRGSRGRIEQIAAQESAKLQSA